MNPWCRYMPSVCGVAFIECVERWLRFRMDGSECVWHISVSVSDQFWASRWHISSGIGFLENFHYCYWTDKYQYVPVLLITRGEGSTRGKIPSINPIVAMNFEASLAQWSNSFRLTFSWCWVQSLGVARHYYIIIVEVISDDIIHNDVTFSLCNAP